MKQRVKAAIPGWLRRAIKRRVLGTRLQPLISWAIIPPQAAPAERAPSPRPCWDDGRLKVCECEMQLGAFEQRRRFRGIVSTLRANDIDFEEIDYEDGFDALAVEHTDVDVVCELLESSGFIVGRRVQSTNVNFYDFPRLASGQDLAEEVPETFTMLDVLPVWYCNARRRNAEALRLRISTYSDHGGYRCFHSLRVPARTVSTRGHRAPAATLAPQVERPPVDAVITTVDGADPAWQERYRRAQQNQQGDDPGSVHTLDKATNEARYTSHGELRFVLRSLHYYAPYVRRIYLVTDRQVPDWLDTSGTVRVVDHADIIPSEERPTFNSDAIESYLWRIPGLSEQFVYFNDDVFLLGPTTPETFFTENGLPRFFASTRALPDISSSDASAYTLHAHLRTAEALGQRGLATPRVKFKHAPFASTRSTWEELEREFAKELEATRREPFRSPAGYATISFLYPHYALARGAGVLSPIKYRYADLAWGDWMASARDILERTDLTAACINESHSTESSEDVDAFLERALRARFPAVAPWER